MQSIWMSQEKIALFWINTQGKKRKKKNRINRESSHVCAFQHKHHDFNGGFCVQKQKKSFKWKGKKIECKRKKMKENKSEGNLFSIFKIDLTVAIAG